MAWSKCAPNAEYKRLLYLSQVSFIKVGSAEKEKTNASLLK